MPNWCSNDFYVGVSEDCPAAQDQLKRLHQIFENALANPDSEDDGLFMQTVPMPAEEAANWHDWSVKNWGTKWDASDVDLIDVSDDSLRARFGTASEPPTAWLDKMRVLFPDLEFSLFYREDNAQLCGYL